MTTKNEQVMETVAPWGSGLADPLADLIEAKRVLGGRAMILRVTPKNYEDLMRYCLASSTVFDWRNDVILPLNLPVVCPSGQKTSVLIGEDGRKVWLEGA